MLLKLLVAKQAMSGYAPSKSTLTDETLVKFLKNDLGEDLESIPGIGPKAKDILIKNGVENSYQLIGQFLTFKKPHENCVTHCNHLFNYLSAMKIPVNKHTIVKSIAEKCSISFPELYNESEFMEECA